MQESVTSFGWSGSAALGGFLINAYGFQLTFFVTASMQVRMSMLAWDGMAFGGPVQAGSQVLMGGIRMPAGAVVTHGLGKMGG